MRKKVRLSVAGPAKRLSGELFPQPCAEKRREEGEEEEESEVMLQFQLTIGYPLP